MASGEQLPLLVFSSTGIPVPHVSEFVQRKLRRRNLAPNTVRFRLVGIGKGLSFITERSIDLDRRAAVGEFLTDGELSSLADRFRWNSAGKDLVVLEYASAAYSAFMEYVGFRFAPFVQRANGALSGPHKEYLRRAEGNSPARANPLAKAPGTREGFSVEQRHLFLEVIVPGHVKNPFRADLQERNHDLLMIPYRLSLPA